MDAFIVERNELQEENNKLKMKIEHLTNENKELVQKTEMERAKRTASGEKNEIENQKQRKTKELKSGKGTEECRPAGNKESKTNKEEKEKSKKHDTDTETILRRIKNIREEDKEKEKNIKRNEPKRKTLLTRPTAEVPVTADLPVPIKKYKFKNKDLEILSNKLEQMQTSGRNSNKGYKTVLVGSSQLRNIQPERDEKVICLPGGRNDDIIWNAVLECENIQEGGHLIVQVTGNGLMGVAPEDTTQIFNSYFKAAKRINPTLKLAAVKIFPRLYEGVGYDYRRQAVNTGLTNVCRSKDVGIIEIAKSWNSWQSIINEDGVHLNGYGKKKLAKKMQRWIKLKGKGCDNELIKSILGKETKYDEEKMAEASAWQGRSSFNPQQNQRGCYTNRDNNWKHGSRHSQRGNYASKPNSVSDDWRGKNHQ